MAQRIIVSPITTLGYDPDLRTTIRGFEKVAMNSAKSIEDFVPRLYASKTFEPKTITYPVYAGIEKAKTWDGKSIIPPASLAYLWDITATVYVYAQSVEHTWEADEFDLYNIGNKKMAELGKAMQHARQVFAHQLFNDALAATSGKEIYDGVFLFSNSHPLDSRIGGVQDNLTTTGALSQDIILEALTKGRNFTDPLGRPLQQTAQAIFCHPDAEQAFLEYMNYGNNRRSGTANNDNNPFSEYGSPKLVVSPWIASSTYWWIKFSGAQAYHCPRIPIKMLEAQKTLAHGIKQDAIFCEGFWVEDWTGWVGGVNTP